jgi:integrase
MFSEEVCPEVEVAHDSIALATTKRRKRGPSLSRRVGQRGNVFQHCNQWNPATPPKTPNAVRVVDVAEPLARLLTEYVSRKSGYLFAAKSGRPLQQRNVLRALHATGKKVGLHAFRRFRTETLRRERIPEDLTKLWLGHSKQTVTDFYAIGLQKDEAWRREWCERAGLGFSLVGLLGLQNEPQLDSVKAA